MDTIKMTRELGKTIQADERYAAYQKAKERNDADEDLQAIIGEFNLLRQKLAMEANQPEDVKDADKVSALNEEAQGVYAKIMENDNMKNFTDAKNEMDALIRDISAIISMCCDGEDPETCELQTQGGCGSGGGCGGCSGCGG
ncbi:MAG: YlbF family regulator [Oscillospiraceae bacterium]|nr:YlbF family regulator [Oscillospiraceae bacterium]